MKQQISVKNSTAILVLLSFYLLTLASPAGAQTNPILTTTVEGTVSIDGPVILPPQMTSVPLRRARVTVYRVEASATGIAVAVPVKSGFTGDNGGYFLSIETVQDPEFEDMDLAVGITLEDQDHLLSVHDQEREPTNPADMISKGFLVKDGATTQADLIMKINSTSNATEYTVQGLSFQPAQGVYHANQGVSNVGGDRFAHLAVMYARVLTAALFVKDVLGEALPSVRVQGWDPGESKGMSYGPCPNFQAIHVAGASSWVINTVSEEADINSLRHEYAHHLMCYSPVAGESDNAADFDHIDAHSGLANSTSGDSWNEGFAEYIPAAIAESLREPEPHVQVMNGGVFDLLSGGARVDNPREKGWQQTYGPLSEELAIASLLWELHANWLGRKELWATLRQNTPDLETFKAVYEALKAAHTAPLVCEYPLSGATASGLDCLFIDRGFYHDFDGDGLYDAGDLVGVTRWPPDLRPSSVFRPAMPVIPGSEMLLTVVDESGAALDGVTLEISVEYEPPLDFASFEYDARPTGLQPYRVPIMVPGNPSRAVVRAVKGVYEPSDGLVIESDFYHDHVNPFRPGGVQDFLVEHRFVLKRSPSANTDPVADANGPYAVPEGGSVTLDGSGSDPDGDPLVFYLGFGQQRHLRDARPESNLFLCRA